MIDLTSAIYKIYPNVVRTVGDEAFDADGNQVEYDADAVMAKAEELRAEKETKTQAAHDKLAELGLTAEDLKRILG